MANQPKAEKSRRNRLITAYFVLAAIIFGELFMEAWATTQCRELGYQTTRALAEEQQLTRLRTELKVELAHLKSPDRIRRIAEDQLGLVMPEARQVVVVP